MSMSDLELEELDSLEIVVIIDNELDPISASPNPDVRQAGNLKDIAFANGPVTDNRCCGQGDVYEMRMDKVCCSAHGLSLMITGTANGKQRTILFDTGPEENAWERNAKRLNLNLGQIETIQLSHWHRDHSGGMLRVLRMINEARKNKPTSNGKEQETVTVDLHPARPIFRGMHRLGMPILSLEADPSFHDIEEAGGDVSKNDQPHTVLDRMFLVSGEIPRLTSYEKGLKAGARFNGSKWEEDLLIQDERLLMCKVKGKGIVMFTGCSHGGVINASKYAISLGGGSPLYAVMGGFHLADAEPEHIQATVDAFKEVDTQALLAGHCTGWRAKFHIEREMPGRLIPSFVGSRFVIGNDGAASH